MVSQDYSWCAWSGGHLKYVSSWEEWFVDDAVFRDTYVRICIFTDFCFISGYSQFKSWKEGGGKGLNEESFVISLPPHYVWHSRGNLALLVFIACILFFRLVDGYHVASGSDHYYSVALDVLHVVFRSQVRGLDEQTYLILVFPMCPYLLLYISFFACFK